MSAWQISDNRLAPVISTSEHEGVDQFCLEMPRTVGNATASVLFRQCEESSGDCHDFLLERGGYSLIAQVEETECTRSRAHILKETILLLRVAASRKSNVGKVALEELWSTKNPHRRFLE
ncbi:hypothetical protein LJR231_005993 [Phyllobacterium sp. LjRoot231]|uniref:hypothetical protein n=1 Tax=Phyllobacterium sp. LjRoot231 TaxID=3342289 RepID=UPI003ECF0EB3